MDQILLHCFNQIHGERSSSNVYYLLKGKRSIQTIQDIHIFKLNHYYGIYKNLSKDNFDKKIQYLLRLKFLTQMNDKELTYRITNQGLEWLHSNSNELYFNGLAYFEKANIFMDRLFLLIQTLTNTKMKFYSFIPVVNNQEVERWVKKVYRDVKGSENNMLHKIYTELHHLLTQFSEKEASIFVNRLSGYKTYGLSLFQMEVKYGQTKDSLHLILESMAHRMIQSMEKNPTNYPTLSFINDSHLETTFLTESAKQTYYYFLKNYTVDQIAKVRGLKENTIYDHLVEIAFYVDDFPIRNYVTIDEEKEILKAIEQANSHRLKNIKNKLKESINYFQIRLVIALENKRIQG